jgi:hypothetical protein
MKDVFGLYKPCQVRSDRSLEAKRDADGMAARSRRMNVYLTERVGRFADGYPSRSARVAVIIDRYYEALRRMRVHERFSDPELRVMRQILRGWTAEPAGVLFGGLLLEIKTNGVGSPALTKKLEALSAFDEVALIEWLEAQELAETAAKADRKPRAR